MALVPRVDLLPQPRPTAQTIRSTTQQPTKIERASRLDYCLTFGGRTHHTLGLKGLLAIVQEQTCLCSLVTGEAMTRFYNTLTTCIGSL